MWNYGCTLKPRPPISVIGRQEDPKNLERTMPATSVSTTNHRRVSLEARDAIVLEHLPLVKAIAIRVHESLPVHVDLDDLIHAGVLGLFDAVEKDGSGKNVAFHAYAKHRIKG